MKNMFDKILKQKHRCTISDIITTLSVGVALWFIVFRVFVYEVYNRNNFYIYLLYFFASLFFIRCFRSKVKKKKVPCSIMSCTFLAVSHFMYFKFMKESANILCAENVKLIICNNYYLFSVLMIMVLTTLFQYFIIVLVEKIYLSRKEKNKTFMRKVIDRIIRK